MGPQGPICDPWIVPWLYLAILDTTGKVGDVVGLWASLLGRPGPAAGPQLADGSGQDLRAPARPQGPIWGARGGARRDRFALQWFSALRETIWMILDVCKL